MASNLKGTEERNPYANHPKLSSLEGEVLWEYAKILKTIKKVDTIAKETAINPNEALLSDLRALEKKMGLVLTLFKASVWAFITDSQAEEERIRMEQEQEQRMALEREQQVLMMQRGGEQGEMEGDVTMRGY